MAGWSDIFVSRERELDALKQAYQQIAEDGITKVVAIVGDAGLGKTRLIQEFYHWLATHNEGEHCNNGYWPDQRLNQINRLRIHPDDEQHDVPELHMPYLWLGLRLAPPGESGQFTNDELRKAHGMLQAYRGIYEKNNKLETIAKETRLFLRERKFELGFGILGLLCIIFEKIGIFPDKVGIVFGILLAVVGIILPVIKMIRKRRADSREFLVAYKLDCQPKAVHQRRQEELNNDLLSWLFQLGKHPPQGFNPIPLVVVLDDTQWLQDNTGMAEFLERLVKQGRAGGWPLLVVMICRKKEWSESAQAGTLPASIFNSSQEDKGDVIIPLGAVAGIEQVIAVAFSGLTAEQRQAIIAKADGYPEALNDILRWMRENKRVFIGQNFSAALTDEGLMELAMLPPPEFAVKRFNDAPEHVQQALVLASMQGMIFSRHIVARMAGYLRLKNVKDVLAGLEQGDDPYDFITLKNDQDGGEFLSAHYYNIAIKNTDNHLNGVAVKEVQEFARNGLVAEIHRANERELEWVFNTGSPNQVRKAGIALVGIANARHDPRTAGTIAKTLLERIPNFVDSADLSGVIICLDAYTVWYGIEQPVFDALEQRLKRTFKDDAKVSNVALRRGIFSILLRLCESIFSREGPKGAKAIFEKLHELERARACEENTLDARRNLGFTLSMLGDVINSLYGPKDARPLLEESLGLYRALAREQNTPNVRRNLSATLSKLGDVINFLDGPKEARPLFEEALDMARILAREQNTIDDRCNLIVALFKLGLVIGRPKEARSLLEESQDLTRALAREQNAPYVLFNLAGINAALDELTSAYSMYTERNRSKFKKPD